MRVLVTGVAGFIGHHLATRLLNLGHEVIGLDNLTSGQIQHIQELKTHKSFSFINHDITTEIELDVDYILNFACPASPIHYQLNPIATFKTSVLGSMHLVELARKLKVPILQASTSEVYGDPEVSPQVESYWGNVNPIGVRSCYDEGKRAAESLFFDYKRQYDVNIKVIRIFNTYGPGMRIDDGRVVSNFITQALRGQDLTIYGDGRQSRSFCYIDDLIDAIVLFMDDQIKFSGPLNLGNPNEFTMLDLAEKAISITGSISKVKFLELPSDDPKQRCPDISKANQILGWHPKINLDEGLTRLAQDFRLRLAL